MMVSVRDGDFVGDRVEKESVWHRHLGLAAQPPRVQSPEQARDTPRDKGPSGLGLGASACAWVKAGTAAHKGWGKTRGRVTRDKTRQRKCCRACASNEILMR